MSAGNEQYPVDLEDVLGVIRQVYVDLYPPYDQPVARRAVDFIAEKHAVGRLVVHDDERGST